MKKIKGNTKLIIGLVVGIFISAVTSYAVAETLIKSADVSYVDNAKLGATNVQAAIDGTCTKFSTELQSFLLKVYPVNSVYISYSNTNPGTLFGGTWENIGSGKVLRGISSGAAGTTGGSETVTLKEENLPSHRHSIPVLTGSTGEAGAHTPSGTISTADELVGKFGDIVYQASLNGGSSSGIVKQNPTENWSEEGGNIGKTGTDGFIIDARHNHTFTGNSVAAHTHTVSTTASNTGYTGSGVSFSTLDPYLTVYMWKRTK